MTYPCCPLGCCLLYRRLLYRRLLGVVLAVFVLISPPRALAEVLTWGDLEPGAHPVGFEVIQFHDATRASLAVFEAGVNRTIADAGRPMQVALWYPAAEASEPFAYSEYLGWRETQAELRRPVALDRQRAAMTLARLLERTFQPENGLAMAKALAEATTRAARDVPPADGRFPLIVWSGDTASSNTLLQEYLASHGYVVASTPGIARHTSVERRGVPNSDSVLLQAEDVAAVISRLRSRPQVDATKIVVAGYSSTSLAALVFQSRTGMARAILSIEGHERYPSGGRVLTNLPGWNPDRVRIPLLYLQADAGRFDRDLSLWEALRATPRTLVDLPRLGHHDLRSEIALSGQRGPEIEEGYRVACRMILAFLEASLSDEGGVDERLMALAVKLPWIDIVDEPATPGVASVDEIWRLLETEDVAGLRSRVLSGRFAPGLLPERDGNRFAYELLRRDHKDLAIEVFRAVAAAYPSSVNSRDSLAEALEAADQKTAALETLHEAIELLNHDKGLSAEARADWQRHFEERLETLGAPIPAWPAVPTESESAQPGMIGDTLPEAAEGGL